ncbi:uncharacterized protein LOC116351077, partial [Contarinia nasturtii]|uniref:uncharacterized protein LOC116351077 n=1 Tax=Contarinia nasturtii TaxID=265458 RepID=UPI0012D4A961
SERYVHMIYYVTSDPLANMPVGGRAIYTDTNRFGAVVIIEVIFRALTNEDLLVIDQGVRRIHLQGRNVDGARMNQSVRRRVISEAWWRRNLIARRQPEPAGVWAEAIDAGSDATRIPDDEIMVLMSRIREQYGDRNRRNDQQ